MWKIYIYVEIVVVVVLVLFLIFLFFIKLENYLKLNFEEKLFKTGEKYNEVIAKTGPAKLVILLNSSLSSTIRPR